MVIVRCSVGLRMVYAGKMELITRPALAQELGISIPSLAKLIAVGIVDSFTMVGVQMVFDETMVTRLKNYGPVNDDHPQALILKTGAARPDLENGRKWQGWKAGVNPGDPDQMDGIRQWWPVRDPAPYVDRFLVPTVAGFVLGVYRIGDYSTIPGGRRSFEISDVTDAPEGEAFRGKRFSPEGGSLTKSV